MLNLTCDNADLKGMDTTEAPGASEASGSSTRMVEEDLKAVLKRQSPGQKEYIEKTLIELSREMALLQNYTILNYTGFIKILKKHDKVRYPHRAVPAVQAPGGMHFECHA